jgi:hypothetical protein
MIKKKYFIIILILFLLPVSTVFAKNKQTVGALENIYVKEAKLNFLARIDTGAKMTSINAQNIKIENPSKKKKENIGKTISFDTINAKGEKSHIVTKIVGIKKVRNAQGVEIRYMVPLTLVWKNSEKVVKVNLRDRSKMTYKLLIGRDWLIGDFVVDVEVNQGD